MFNFYCVNNGAILYKTELLQHTVFFHLKWKKDLNIYLCLVLTWKHCCSERSRTIGSSHHPSTAVSLELTPDVEESFYSNPVPFTKGITSSFEKDTSLFEHCAPVPYHTQLLNQYSHTEF